MSQLTGYTATGRASGQVSAQAAIFGLKLTSHDLLKQAYLTHQANGRVRLAETKTRGLVRGGGRKPWRQKGTGRARAGSIRSPIWRGGGITFGPNPERNFKAKLNQKQARLALRQALSVRAQQTLVIAGLKLTGKTAQASQLLTKLGCQRRTLIVEVSPSPQVKQATANLNQVELTTAQQLNICQVLNADHLLISQAGLKALEDRLGGQDA